MQTENKKEQVNIEKFSPLHVNHGGHPDNGRIQIGSAKDYIAEMYSDEPYEGEDYITDAESHALADELVKRYNTQPKLAKALQDMIDEAKGAIFMFGNENNYPEGTGGYRIRNRLEGASENAKKVLEEAGLTKQD